MSTIAYRQLDANGDPLWGQGVANFLTDRMAVAQVVLTRLRLFQGEWWADTADGLPLWQSILGQGASARAQEQASALITARVLGSPFVVGISNLQTAFARPTRGPFVYSATADTQFGQLTVANFPQPPSGALP